MTFGTADLTALLPSLIVMIAGLLAVAVDTFERPMSATRLPAVALSFAGLVGASVLLARHLGDARAAVHGFGGALILDDLAAFLSLVILVSTALVLVSATSDTRRRRIDFGEYYGLVMTAAAAMILLVQSGDLLMVFLSLEILSIALYVLTGVTRRNPRSNEAAMKYLVTGAFATGFLVMGIAYLYGATGTIRLGAIGASIAGGNGSPLVSVGFGLLLVGFAFKIGAVPFHMWVPDVYEGAPTSTTAFMAVTVKAAGLGALIRIVITAAGSRPELWAEALWWISVATMVVGNLLAVQQRSVKRMLAYSSVAHTGYALVAVTTMLGTDGSYSTQGAAAAIFYLLVYAFMTLGAFTLLVYVGHEVVVEGRSHPEWQDGEHLDDLAGLANRRPAAAFAMMLFMVSLGGLPPTAGFFGKFWLFSAAVEQGHVVLAVVGVLASVVSLYYYLRVIVSMYMQPEVIIDEKPAQSVGFVVFAAAVGTVALGLLPEAFLVAAERGITLLGG